MGRKVIHMSKLLVVEDDAFLRDGLSEILTKEGYQPQCAISVAEAKAFLSSNQYALIILDVMLPDGDGFALCQELRRAGCVTPILFLTACDDEIQIVRGLDAGGDDYVTKPFKLLELLSRIRALLRRGKPAVYQSGELSVDRESMTVRKNGETVFVTPTEFQILSTLLQNSGLIVTRSVLIERIWDDGGNFIDDNTLSVHVSRLREKIGAEHIKTIRGVGYRWEEKA